MFPPPVRRMGGICLPSRIFYRKWGIQNIELGSNHDYVEGMEGLLKRHSKKNFIVHNCFPPAKVPLMMNLAAPDERMRINQIYTFVPGKT